MEDSNTISKKPEEKKPIERMSDDIKKISKDIIEIKSVIEEIKQEFKDFNENAKKGWFY
jgi:hypothetical protein